MSAMNRIATRIQEENLPYDPEADLPLPNLYWATLTRSTGSVLNTFVAADHTTAAIAKLSNWCAVNHKFRPHRSNSAIRLRRMLLGDVIHNPDSFNVAFETAVLSRESDIVASLNALPDWIANHVGIGAESAKLSTSQALWQRVGAELDRINAPVRVLR